MIKAEELRHGNYLTDTSGFVFRVDDISVCKNGSVKMYENYKPGFYTREVPCIDLQLRMVCPIVITHEVITEWCGFECVDIGQYQHEKLGAVTFNTKTELDENFTHSGYDFGVFCCIPNYLHQLQNLFFALKNEELQITIKSK